MDVCPPAPDPPTLATLLDPMGGPEIVLEFPQPQSAATPSTTEHVAAGAENRRMAIHHFTGKSQGCYGASRAAALYLLSRYPDGHEWLKKPLLAVGERFERRAAIAWGPRSRLGRSIQKCYQNRAPGEPISPVLDDYAMTARFHRFEKSRRFNDSDSPPFGERSSHIRQ